MQFLVVVWLWYSRVFLLCFCSFSRLSVITLVHIHMNYYRSQVHLSILTGQAMEEMCLLLPTTSNGNISFWRQDTVDLRCTSLNTPFYCTVLELVFAHFCNNLWIYFIYHIRELNKPAYKCIKILSLLCCWPKLAKMSLCGVS